MVFVLFGGKKKEEKKVLNYIAVRKSTQSFWEIFRIAAKHCLIFAEHTSTSAIPLDLGCYLD